MKTTFNVRAHIKIGMDEVHVTVKSIVYQDITMEELDSQMRYDLDKFKERNPMVAKYALVHMTATVYIHVS